MPDSPPVVGDGGASLLCPGLSKPSAPPHPAPRLQIRGSVSDALPSGTTDPFGGGTCLLPQLRDWQPMN